jgi:hypothetical protein
MGVYKLGHPSLLTMLVGNLATQQTRGLFVRLLFVRY